MDSVHWRRIGFGFRKCNIRYPLISAVIIVYFSLVHYAVIIEIYISMAVIHHKRSAVTRDWCLCSSVVFAYICGVFTINHKKSEVSSQKYLFSEEPELVLLRVFWERVL